MRGVVASMLDQKEKQGGVCLQYVRFESKELNTLYKQQELRRFLTRSMYVLTSKHGLMVYKDDQRDDNGKVVSVRWITVDDNPFVTIFLTKKARHNERVRLSDDEYNSIAGIVTVQLFL